MQRLPERDLLLDFRLASPIRHKPVLKQLCAHLLPTASLGNSETQESRVAELSGRTL
jgi:hypothetical protein